jgi:hypothetical protein
MKCKHIKVLLADFLDRNLSSREAASVEDHVEHCPDCREELDFLKKYKKEMSHYPDVKAPADFLQRLHRRIDNPAGKSSLLQALFFPLKIKLPLEAAGAFALALIVVFLFNPFKSEYPGHVIEKDSPRTARGVDERDTTSGIAKQRARASRPEMAAGDTQKKTGDDLYSYADKHADDTRGSRSEEVVTAENIREKKEAEATDSGELTLYLARTIPGDSEPMYQEKMAGESKKARKDIPGEEKNAARAAKADTSKRQGQTAFQGMPVAEQEIENIVSSVKGSILKKTQDEKQTAGHLIVVEIPAENYKAFIDRLGGSFSVRKQGIEMPQIRTGKVRLRIYIKQ